MDNPPPKLNLGARLKSIRLQKGLTVRELARKAGCSASFISQLELNQASPTIANFEKICGALKMSLVDMLREEVQLQEPIKIPLHTDTQSLAMRWQKAWMRHLLPGRETKAFTALPPLDQRARHHFDGAGRTSSWRKLVYARAFRGDLF
jgi:transcriptional regulator with XRE-family HTH domain